MAIPLTPEQERRIRAVLRNHRAIKVPAVFQIVAPTISNAVRWLGRCDLSRGPLTQENRENHTETERKEPQCGCRCARRTEPAQLPR